MASFSNTELNATVDEKWDQDIEDARYANGVFLNRIANKSARVVKSGDILHVTIKQRYTVGDVGANGAFTPQVWTSNSVPITVNQYKQVAVEVEDLSAAQSFWNPDSDFPTDAGKAYAEYYDTLIAGQYASFNALAEVGNSASPTAFGKQHMTTAMLRLSDANIPEENLSFFLPPIGWFSGLLNEVQFTAADQSGQSKNVLTSGYQFSLLGVPFYKSTTIATVVGAATVRKGLLLHKSAMGIAFQKNNEIKRAERTAALVASSVILVKSLLGIAVIRSDHGVVINIAAS